MKLHITAEQCAALKAQGMSNDAIGEHLGCSAPTVRNRLTKGTPNGKWPQCIRIWESRMSDVVAMRLRRCSYDEIGKKYGVSRERIRQVLNSYSREFVVGTSFSPTIWETAKCAFCRKDFRRKKTEPGKTVCDTWCKMRLNRVPIGREIVERRLAGEKWRQLAVDYNNCPTDVKMLYRWACHALDYDQRDRATWKVVFPNVGKQVAYR